MRAFIQRVISAEVTANGQVIGHVGRGLLIYLGIGATDCNQDADRLAEKIANLRIFEDTEGKLNLSVQDIRGGVLVISSFTLMGDTIKGRRPSFAAAATADSARPLYEAFTASLEHQGCLVERGAFGEHMNINSLADGPVNVIVEYPSDSLPGGGRPSPGAKSYSPLCGGGR